MIELTTIAIRTRLHDGIYRSSGGGEVTTHYTWATGPLNLMRALKTLPEHRHRMIQGYGNVGHIESWVEIEGVAIDDTTTDYADLTLADARTLIQDVRSGAYAAEQAVWRSVEEELLREQDRRLGALGWVEHTQEEENDIVSRYGLNSGSRLADLADLTPEQED